MKHKITVAITGASGSIYAKVLLDKLILLKNQIDAVGIVMSKMQKMFGNLNSEIRTIKTILLNTTKKMILWRHLPQVQLDSTP